jgi:aldose 1-epimerase
MEFTASIPSGMRAKWFSCGATLAELHVPDAQGRLADVVLGFDDEASYLTPDNQHFGCTTGRVANRISQARFTLDGREYQLLANKGEHHLHGGGHRNLAAVDWQGEPFKNNLGSGMRFRYTSPDGEEGYPGTLDMTVTYLLSIAGAVRIDYTATTDKPTPVNLTNHSYFNLSGAGEPSVLDHEAWIDADRYTPKGAGGIPTGEVLDLSGTPYDFRQRRRIGDRIDQLGDEPADGYDDNYVLNGEPGQLRAVAEIFDPASGRKLRVLTDQPAMQLYVGNSLRGQRGKGGRVYARRSALCLETQFYPDAVNKPQFPSIILRPGETYRHTCVYEFSAEETGR